VTAERAPALRAARGLVFFRLAARPSGPIPFRVVEPVLTRLRASPGPPPYGATAWRPAGGEWSEDLGGRWLARGDGRLNWEWLG
jgi:hypothetical protein